MHILLIHQSFAALDEPGGTRHHELALYLAERGHDVTVIASPVSYLTGSARASQPAPPEARSGTRTIRILRAYTYSALHRSFVHRIFSFLSFMASSFLTGIRVPKVDLVWGTSPPIFQGVTAWALAKIKRAPFLFEVRDLWPDFAIGVGVLSSPVLIRLSHWLERFLYSQADRVMVNSPGFSQHVSQRGARQVELIPNGADPRMFTPDARGEAFRQAHGFGDRFAAMYAGAHGLSNDLEIVLQAADQLRERRDILFVLLGDGKEKAALVQRAADLDLSNVLFLPPVAKTGMAEALSAADACIAILKPISLYATVYPNKVFDYMAAGRPVLLAIDGVIRQVVEEAGAGVFVQPGSPSSLAQAVAALADDPEKTLQMGQRGRRDIETRFDRAALAQKLAEILEAMGGRKP